MLIKKLSLMFALLHISATEVLHLTNNCTILSPTSGSLLDYFNCTEYATHGVCGSNHTAYMKEKEYHTPAKPKSISLKTDNESGVNITWKPNQDGSVEFLKGFEVEIKSDLGAPDAASGPSQCYFLSIANVSSYAEELMGTTFKMNVKLPRCKHDVPESRPLYCNYTLQLSGLPKSDSNYVEKHFRHRQPSLTSTTSVPTVDGNNEVTTNSLGLTSTTSVPTVGGNNEITTDSLEIVDVAASSQMLVTPYSLVAINISLMILFIY